MPRNERGRLSPSRGSPMCQVLREKGGRRDRGFARTEPPGDYSGRLCVYAAASCVRCDSLCGRVRVRLPWLSRVNALTCVVSLQPSKAKVRGGREFSKERVSLVRV